jgi:predicted signal transduction protein with EAL and GGDEF domain
MSRLAVDAGLISALWVDKDDVRLTASIGFACCPRAETNVEHLLQRANDALYAAKVAGRSCSVFYQRLGDEADRLGARLASQSCNSPKLRRCFALI